jgi:Mn2+/Fe2+ NRAMP family transporter
LKPHLAARHAARFSAWSALSLAGDNFMSSTGGASSPSWRRRSCIRFSAFAVLTGILDELGKQKFVKMLNIK